MIVNPHWSDRFFNYVPAEQSHGRCGTVQDSTTGIDVSNDMVDAATQFREANPACPYTVMELIADFYRRL